VSGGRARRLRALTTAAAASAVLLLASCTTDGTAGGTAPGESAPQVFETDVDVATPELAALRAEAGMEPCGAPERPPVEGGLPEVTLPCLGGGEDVTLSSLRGPLVVNLWASWCGPCREELPYYERLHEQGGVPVLGIDYQDVLPAEALQLAAETGVTYPSLADPGGALRGPLRVRGLPLLLLVAEDGTVAYRDFVAIESYEQLAGLVEEHLDVTVGGAG
jgi:thiol-disulfide isomerase/thioredoxin